MGILTAGQSRRVLKSWYTGWGGGGAEQGFRRYFADGLNKSLVSSVAQATIFKKLLSLLFVYKFLEPQ